jgi:hypothetical protein
MKTIWTLYCHTHIASDRRYIGLTQKTMLHRWNQHYAQAKRLTGKTSHFINAIRKHGKDAFSHEVLAQSWTLEGANATEEELILQYDTRNQKVGFNVMRGGEHQPHPFKNPWKRPDYRSKNISRSIAIMHTPQARVNNKAAHNTDEYKARISIIVKEVWMRPEFKQKQLDKVVSPKSREKIAFANKGKVMSPETCARVADARRGTKHSLETRAKISAAGTGRKHSPESILKMSAVQIGRKHSAESIAKMRSSYWRKFENFVMEVMSS